MKRWIYNTKRFIHSLKVRWRTRKTPKIWREPSYLLQMVAYDMAQTLKGIRPMTRETLDRMAKLTGVTERQKEETDDELRKRTMEAVKRKGGVE